MGNLPTEKENSGFWPQEGGEVEEGKKSYELPVEIVKVVVIIAPGSDIKCIKNASFVQGRDGIKRLEIEYVTEFGVEGKFWFNADGLIRDVKETVARGEEPKYVFNLHAELV